MRTTLDIPDNLVNEAMKATHYQYKCLKNGLNGVGIPDLIIAQNAKQNECNIYTLDHHFNLMKDIISLQIQI